MSTAKKISAISVGAYFEMEEKAVERHEYHKGEVFAMSGGTYDHNTIISNLNGEIRAALRGTDCRVVAQDLKVQLATFSSFVYPDVLVIYGGPDFYADRKDTICNPSLIIEVLSESTAYYDRGLKFMKYRSLESLREYVLVEQNFPQIDCYYRSDNGEWIFNTYQDLADQVHFRSIDIRVPLHLIYEGLELGTPPLPDA